MARNGILCVMGRDEMRAADSDRQAVADKLKKALDEGRLDLAEYDERLQRAYAAKTYGGSELPGISVFYKEADGTMFHTYSTYARGLELMNTAYQYLDLVPKGRDEQGLSFPMAWVRRHDQYEA